MRFSSRLGVFGALMFSLNSAHAVDIKGAGANPAEAMYKALAAGYGKTDPFGFSYQATDSADGIKQIRAKAVDFGATEILPSKEQRKQDNLVAFPTAISGVAPIFNLPGLRSGQLKLTGELLADIFSRKIVKWNDPRLVAVNAGVALPDLPINVLVRSDNSGTTYNFTEYLSQSSPAWKAAYARNFTIAWAAGTTPIKGSAATATAMKTTVGAIGYVDFKFASREKLSLVSLKNRDGNFVLPGAAAFSAAIANSSWMTKPEYDEMLINRPGAASWPITASTFVLVPRASSAPERTVAVLKMFTWGFMHGDEVVGKNEYVRLPEAVQGRIFGEMGSLTDAAGAPLKWSLADIMKL